MKPTFITVKATKHYGRITVYPVCPTAKLFTQIAGTKTLTQRVLNLISELGYAIYLEQSPSLTIEEVMGA